MTLISGLFCSRTELENLSADAKAKIAQQLMGYEFGSMALKCAEETAAVFIQAVVSWFFATCGKNLLAMGYKSFE